MKQNTFVASSLQKLHPHPGAQHSFSALIPQLIMNCATLHHPRLVLSATFALLLASQANAQTENTPKVDPNGGRNFVKERAEAAEAHKMLSRKWLQLSETPPVTPSRAALQAVPRFSNQLKMADLQKLELEARLTAPQRASLAIQTLNGYTEPEEIRSINGVLTAELVVTYARNFIGTDPVYLRTYNGHLVGPTLRAKRGDTLRITVKNNLPTQPWQKDAMNTLHDFNTTNLHTHGLHVSPNGISDNVLLEIEPGATQQYEIVIPPNHTCGTYWYHAHRHGSTAGNVASGMSGALIIEGDLDEVPEIKAAKERVMVLNQIPYIYKNTLKDNNGNDITFDFPEGIIEENLAGYIFGPGDWSTLGRYTTVNGVQLPVIRMKPGQVERWRIVDSGQRETIDLQITTLDGTTEGIPFNEIAVDGLPLGKMIRKNLIELLPGYRSDVLVKAPDQPGEYLLVDQATTSGIAGQGEPLKYIARIVVEGSAVAGNLPTDGQLAKYRLPTLKDAKIDASQKAVYGILPVATGGVIFTIDGKPFDMEDAKELLLGNTDEWTVSVRNGGGINTGHPFHIHVNPFEVLSIKGPQDPNNPQSPQVEQLKDGPVWRDTIWVPNNGTVTFRTRYDDFIGTFVQHCHILDHEDQGMMQLVDIRDPKAPLANVTHPPVLPQGAAAPAFDLRDANDLRHREQDYAGQPHVVFFFKGHGCAHCSRQVAEFTALCERFQEKGVRVIGITSDSADSLKAALKTTPCPFPILADPDGRAFAAYGCAGENDLVHGTFVIDEKGRIAWSTTGPSPYMNIAGLLQEFPSKSSTLAGDKKQASAE
jgi:FtsP/CotA-like multicopper oxidase with cupredoxin domain/peroxiredoxin